MQTRHPSVAPDYYKQAGNHRPGGQVNRTLLTGKDNSVDNYKMNIGGGEGNSEAWTAPRHRHNFEQIRYVLSGEYVIGKEEVLPAGWVAYFPELAFYGPQVKTPGLLMVGLQYGGPSGLGYRSVSQRKQAFEDLLAKGGKFENGAYTWVDEDGRRHNMDSAEAIYEQIYGHKIVYPTGRYRDLVLMNPAGFDWVKDKDQAGVAHKRMGAFTERDIRIGFIRMERGATLRFGTEKSVELLFLKDGTLAHDGKSFETQTAFSLEADDSPVSLTAAEPAEMLYIKLPTFWNGEPAGR